MNEPHVVEHLLAYVNGNLDDTAARMVAAHLASCPDCRQEYEALGSLWRDLGRSQDIPPHPSLHEGFNVMLAAYEKDQQRSGRRKAAWFWGAGTSSHSWLARPAGQFALAALLLVIAFAGGYGLGGRRLDSGEISQLRGEVRDLHNLLTVSLLQQSSASERLKGVSWSSRIEGPDPQIRAALVNTMKHDPNINVRLAALSALSQDLTDLGMREEIIHTLPEQTSPLMQMALVNLLAQMNDRDSRAALKQMLNKPDLHPEVRNRIKESIQATL